MFNHTIAIVSYVSATCIMYLEEKKKNNYNTFVIDQKGVDV